MDGIIKKLCGLGFSNETYSEVLLTININNDTNVAPMGVLLKNNKLYVRIYSGTKTYNAILNYADECVLNITNNPKLFFNAILHKEKIRFYNSTIVNAKRVLDCDAYIECNINKRNILSNYAEIFLNPLIIDVVNPSVKTYNRAGPAIIEALVHLSKIQYYKSSGMNNNEILKRFLFLREIVYHSTSDKDYRIMINEILDKAEKFINQ